MCEHWTEWPKQGGQHKSNKHMYRNVNKIVKTYMLQIILYYIRRLTGK